MKTLQKQGSPAPAVYLSFLLSCSLVCSAGANSFSVDDDTVIAGAAVTLHWEVDTDSSLVTIDPGIGDVSGVTVDGLGSLVISPGPTASTTYTLNTDGPAGPQSVSVPVIVGNAPDIRTFSAEVDTTNPAIRRILSWDVVNATSLEIAPGLGRVPVSGVGYYPIVAAGSVWNYLDDGSAQGSAWTAVDYDDSGWAAGPAELGYGERDEATVVGFGGVSSAKFITTYFRQTFARTAVDAIAQLRLGIKYDDGAVVYLNGIEVARFNLPLGVIDHTTPALGDAPGDANDYVFQTIPPEILREGRNVLAVEIHQSRPASSDMSFDLMLEGFMDGALAVVPPGNTTYTLSATNDFGTSTGELEVVVSIKPVAAYGFDSASLQDSVGLTSSVVEGATPPVFVQEPRRHGVGACQFGGAGGVRISGAGLLSALGAEPVGDALSVAFWMRADPSATDESTLLDGGIEFSRADLSDPMGLCVELPNDQEVVIGGVFDGAWHHVALVLVTGTSVAPGELRLFRDGELSSTQAYLGGGLDLPDEWVLGSSASGADGFAGALDDFAVFDRAISAAELTQLVEDAAVSFLVPGIFAFESDDQKVSPGAEVKLSWLAVDAESVTISPLPGPVDAIGEAIVRPVKPTTYVLTASNPHGSATREVTVVTGPVPVIHQFSITPDLISVTGGSADLEWDVSGSTSVVIDRGIGAVARSGGIAVVLTSLSSFRLTAENDFGTNTAVATATVVDEPGEEPWTMVIIPDTQHYSDNVANAPIFTEITNWIADHEVSHNIRFVLQEGDIVENNTAVEWDRARASLGVLDGRVPYAITTGNHDLGPGGSASTRDGEFNFATRFGAGSPYAGQATLAGYYEGSGDPDYRESSYHTFHAKGFDYLVLALEWSPRDEVVEWANRVVAAHPSHRAILLTHMYLTGANSRWTGGVSLGDNNGENLWQKLVRKHENFIMTANGHDASYGYLASLGDQGNTVHQMLFNAQFEANGGDGWIRLLEFDPDGQTVSIKTFSPHLEALGLSAYRTDAGNQYTLQLSKFPGVDADGDHIPDGWESAYGLDPADPGDALLDPNGNGLSNFLEYALAGRPFAGNRAAEQGPITVVEAENGRNRIQFKRRVSGATKLDYFVEKSCDLQRWISDPGNGSSFAELSVFNNGDATETVVVEDRGTTDPDQPVFYRLRIVGDG